MSSNFARVLFLRRKGGRKLDSSFRTGNGARNLNPQSENNRKHYTFAGTRKLNLREKLYSVGCAKIKLAKTKLKKPFEEATTFVSHSPM